MFPSTKPSEQQRLQSEIFTKIGLPHSIRGADALDRLRAQVRAAKACTTLCLAIQPGIANLAEMREEIRQAINSIIAPLEALLQIRDAFANAKSFLATWARAIPRRPGAEVDSYFANFAMVAFPEAVELLPGNLPTYLGHVKGLINSQLKDLDKFRLEETLINACNALDACITKQR